MPPVQDYLTLTFIYDFETSKNGLWATKKPDKIGLSAGYIFFVPF